MHPCEKRLQPASTMTDRSIYKYSFGVFMVFLIVVSGSNAYKAKVTTRFGQVQGLLSRSTRGRLVAHYLGIPFAQPPVNDLRFRVSLYVNMFYYYYYYYYILNYIKLFV